MNNKETKVVAVTTKKDSEMIELCHTQLFPRP